MRRVSAGAIRGEKLGNCGTILVVDHDDTTRIAAAHVATRLGYDVSTAENAELALKRLADDAPALAIVGVELRGATSGLELLRELHDRFGVDLPVLLLARDRNEPIDRVAGLMLGADDYLAKPVDRGELLARTRRSLRRVPNGVRRNGASRDVSLSPREREILSLLADGRTQSEIAHDLVISSKTVATHIQHLLAKLGVHSRAQAVARAYRLGLVEPDVRAHALALAE